jgi:hypothetical protein
VKEGKRKKANTPLVTDMDLPTDVAAMVQSVLRESYRETSEDLRSYAEKVRYLNTQKKTVRRYLASLRQFRANVMSAARERGVDLCDTNENDLAILTKLFKEHARPYDVGEVEYELCIPNRVPRASADSLALLDNEIARWEERLATVGDDSQLANVDMQNMLQKQQQTMQMMSNISKMLHDTAMSVIRKLGG